MEVLLLLTFLLFLTKNISAGATINCNDGNFYIRADPESCGHFYKCDHGNPVRFTCLSGLYFNPSLYVCDWPYNVKCNVNSQSNSNGNIGNTGQYNGNTGTTGQYNGNTGTTGQYNDNTGNTGQHNGNTGNQYDGSYDYPEQNPETLDSGPSIQDPLDPNASNRPRPTIDDLYSERNQYPYNGYSNQNPSIDIRK